MKNRKLFDSTIEGSITGNDSIESKPKPKGFGIPIADAKTRLYAKKKPSLLNGSDRAGTIGISGSDAVPESNSVDSTIDLVDTSGDGTDEQPISIKKSELNGFIAAKATEMADTLQKDLMAQFQAMKDDIHRKDTEFKEQLTTVSNEANQWKAEADRLASVFKATGTSAPIGDASSSRYGLNINKLILPSSAEPQGAAKDFVDMFNNPQYSPKRVVYDPADGSEYVQRDTRETDAFIRKNADALRDAFELVAKANGLLRGNRDFGKDSKPGFTLGTQGGIPDAFLAYLSDIIRMTHVQRYIWWQFPDTKLELGGVPGNNILVPRFALLDEPTTIDDFILDTATSTTSISPESQALQMSTVPVELFGCGLGKGTNVGNRAIGVPEFIAATSLVQLINVLNSRLGIHYNAFIDLWIRRLYQQATNNAANIYYNEGGNLTQTPANINTGEEATCTQEALNAMSSEMSRRGIPTFENGLRVAVLHTYAANQLKNDMDNKLAIVTEQQLQDITQILNAGSLGNGIDRLSGYLGNYNGFMCFESTTTGVGLPGPNNLEGVNSITFGVGARTTRDNYFFGPGVVGQGVASPMEIRQDGSGTFGTSNRYIWRSIEGFGNMDCCSLNASGQATGQQDRVTILRTVDQAI
jgi:hypothetical protein